MIAYRDFVPRMLSYSDAQYESFDAAVDAANQWVQEHGLRVFNVETVVLPNIWDQADEGSIDPSLPTPAGANTTWHQFIRVWYEPPAASPAPVA